MWTLERNVPVTRTWTTWYWNYYEARTVILRVLWCHGPEHGVETLRYLDKRVPTFAGLKDFSDRNFNRPTGYVALSVWDTIAVALTTNQQQEHKNN